MQESSYDADFFQLLEESALRSARSVLPKLQKAFNIRSVLDVGCGYGAWLKVWKQLGVEDVCGLDGSYVDVNRLLIPKEQFHAADLSHTVALNRQFDFVESLEVGEHIGGEYADNLLDTIVNHGKAVLFSAAVPGQGGTNHVNEQPFEYWRDRFRKRGYLLYDYMRPAILQDMNVDKWYRYNSLLFVHESLTEQLPEDVKRTRVADTSPIPVVAPLFFKIRCKLLSTLGPDTMTKIVSVRHRYLAAKHQRRQRKQNQR